MTNKLPTLEEQVTNLELSIKAKELGFLQESLWWWVDSGYDVPDPYIIVYKHNLGNYKIKYSAYTVAEWGMVLPDGFHTTRAGIINKEHQVRCFYNGFESKFDFVKAQVADTEANVRAKMAIHLKEKGLI